MQGNGSSDRLDRIEAALESMTQVHARLARHLETVLEIQAEQAVQQSPHSEAIARIHEEHARYRAELRDLLTAQVLLTDAQRQADVRLKDVAAKLTELAEAQRHTAERLNALIAVVDDFIRRQPRQ